MPEYPRVTEVASRDFGNIGLKILRAILTGGFYGNERFEIE